LNACAAVLVGDQENAKTLLGQIGNIANDRLARLYLQAGDHEKAETLAKKAVDDAENEVIPLANQIDVLFRIGKEKEAAEAFEKLRKISGAIDDLTLAPFQRLADVAAANSLPADWRIATDPRDDIGQRPELDSIGPLRYSAPRAVDWILPNGDGDLVDLRSYRGKPVVVIFYLGAGCLHCVQQLTTFAPVTQQFDDAGISLIGISTDNVGKLKTSLDKFQVDGEFPFPLLSDASMEMFKAYRAFDDFEDQALHGTFLIDPNGQLLWQDISYEPFEDPEFLLREAQRLLRLEEVEDQMALGAN
ncbi:MAG: redoxin domain-containing protein, partial [Planctomycetota bacterium]